MAETKDIEVGRLPEIIVTAGREKAGIEGLRDQETRDRKNEGLPAGGRVRLVTVSLPCGEPLTPLVVGIEGRGNKKDNDDGEKKLHRYRDQRYRRSGNDIN